MRSRPLRWELRDDAIGSPLRDLHTRLAALRNRHPALRSPFMYPTQWDTWQTQFNPQGVGVDVDRQLVIYHRWAQLPSGDTETAVIVLNFSDVDQLVQVPFPVQGQWSDELATFRGGPDWSVMVAGPTAAIPVGSHWGRVFFQR